MKKLMMILWYLSLTNTTFSFSKADSLRGSNGTHRSWWDVLHYQLKVYVEPDQENVSGQVDTRFVVRSTSTGKMQIDLQKPLEITKARLNNQDVSFSREGNVFWIDISTHNLKVGDTAILQCQYFGKPRQAKMAPWDGGFVRKKDNYGKPWIAVACQGIGASIWWPCKDLQSEEPEMGMDIIFLTTSPLPIISNGRSQGVSTIVDSSTRKKLNVHRWKVTQPINSYNVTFYMGDYVHWAEELNGAKGILDMDFYVLRQDSLKAVTHLGETRNMLLCFENWMGPYPFYEDGYKLVQAPYLGMEHQSAIAYGNQFKKGYLGIDRSNTDVGLLWDYILIHESGHEWFGNNITAQDQADNWIHEGFTCYTEALYSEWILNKEAGYRYAEGLYSNIENMQPVIAPYGVNAEGTSDKYDKGSAIVHMLRLIINNDDKFRMLLIEMNERFFHKIVTSVELEDWIQKELNINLQKFFDQYLRTIKVPKLIVTQKGPSTFYHFENTISGFALPYFPDQGVPIWIGEHQVEINDGERVIEQLQHYYITH